MSGNELRRERAEHGPLDLRTKRTLESLLASFNELVLARRYDEIKVGDILEDAAVGRSTFYEHFAGKDELLLRAMQPLFDQLASLADDRAHAAQLESVLEHFDENREVARYLLAGPPSRDLEPRMSRELARRVEAHLVERLTRRPARAALPLAIIAQQLAAAELAVLRLWLGGRCESDATALARGLRASAQGSLAALLIESDPS